MAQLKIHLDCLKNYCNLHALLVNLQNNHFFKGTRLSFSFIFFLPVQTNSETTNGLGGDANQRQRCQVYQFRREPPANFTKNSESLATKSVTRRELESPAHFRTMSFRRTQGFSYTVYRKSNQISQRINISFVISLLF